MWALGLFYDNLGRVEEYKAGYLKALSGCLGNALPFHLHHWAYLCTVLQEISALVLHIFVAPSRHRTGICCA